MTYRVRRSLHRVTKSLSVKKKSPMSVWRRSMFSTRKTQDRFGAWYRKPEVAAAAAVAEAAEVVGVAEAVVDAGDAAVAVAVCRGVLAASARPDRLPIALTNAGHFGRDRQSRPGQSMSSLKCGPFTRGGVPAAKQVSNLVEKCKRPSWTKQFQCSENTPCKSEPEWQARCAC
jgi:hypothetical protein